jgi:thiol-disulfide isomerase/thioredoxin
MKNRTTWTVAASFAAGAVALLLLGAAPESSLNDQVAALTQRVMNLEKEMAAMTTQVTWNHPDEKTEQSAASQLATINGMVSRGQAAEAKPALDQFMAQYANTKAAAQAAALVDSLASVGKAAPAAWEVDKWYQGSDSDLTASGTTVVIFWETWCPHCRRALPLLQAMHDQFEAQGLNMVGLTKLSRNSTDAQVEEFIAQNKIRFSMGKENGRVSAYFGVSGIPDSAVIKDGKVIWSGHPAAINNSMVQGWLADMDS